MSDFDANSAIQQLIDQLDQYSVSRPPLKKRLLKWSALSTATIPRVIGIAALATGASFLIPGVPPLIAMAVFPSTFFTLGMTSIVLNDVYEKEDPYYVNMTVKECLDVLKKCKVKGKSLDPDVQQKLFDLVSNKDISVGFWFDVQNVIKQMQREHHHELSTIKHQNDLEKQMRSLQEFDLAPAPASQLVAIEPPTQEVLEIKGLGQDFDLAQDNQDEVVFDTTIDVTPRVHKAHRQ